MATTIAATGDALLDAINGICDRNDLAKDLLGLAAVPATELGWIFDLCSGDGSWSKVAASYAPEARVISFDWRSHAREILPGCRAAVIAAAPEVWTPCGYTVYNNIPYIELTKSPSLSLPELLEQESAVPQRTAVRYQGLAGNMSLLDGVSELRMFTGSFFGSSEALRQTYEVLLSCFDTIIDEKKGDVFYVKCYNPGPPEQAVPGG